MLSIPKSNTFYKCRTSLLPLPVCFHSSSSTTNQINYVTYLLDQFLSTPITEIKSLLQSHAFIITTGNSNNLFIAAKLISFYSSFNKPNSSTHVFNSINPKDTFLWNSLIKSHFSNGDYPSALHFYIQMHRSDRIPNHFTIPMVVSASAEVSSLKMGQSVHCIAVQLGLFAGNSAVAVGSSFVYMYARLCEMKDAFNMFDEMIIRDVVAWTALVIGYVQNDESERGLRLLCEMHKISEDGGTPNFRTIAGGFQACANLGAIVSGRSLHGYALKAGIGCSPFVQSSLLSMYSKCATLDEAHVAFRELADKDLISWTVIIGAYARCGSMFECLELFREMQVYEMIPDGVIISCLLSGFGNVGSAYYGKAFHAMVFRRNFEFDQMVSNSLLLMYCKLECLDIAEKLFDRLSGKGTESWNAMISGYGTLGLDSKCINLFREIQYLGVESDMSTLVLVISSCSRLVSPHLGRSVHCYAHKSRVSDNISVTNSLVGMYGRFGNLTIAERIFHRANRDIVTWNILISSYAHNGHPSGALALFDQMLSKDMKPNSATLVTALSACSHLTALDCGKRLHTCIKEMGFECDISVATALVDMYAKCGELQISRAVFNSVPVKDAVLWNVMISGYGIHGDAKSAIEVFRKMEESGMKPNGLSFLAVLSACSHAGLVEEGKYHFARMEDFSVVPTLKHYACMVDLLGRSGNLLEAEAMIRSMPIAPDGGMWGALLGACKIHNDVETGQRVAKQAIVSDPENDGYYIILSNMYSSLGRWEEAHKVRGIMKNRGVKKQAGWSTT